jgi:putative flippase GtrA
VTSAHPSLVERVLRCFGVSVTTTLLSLSILVVLTTFGMAGAPANVIATVCGIGPSYMLNRRWVWRLQARSDVWHEVVPFWSLALVGLVASTVAVAVADSWASAMGLDGLVRSMALVTANLFAFGVLWVAQFLVLDRILFGRHHHHAMEITR